MSTRVASSPSALSPRQSLTLAAMGLAVCGLLTPPGTGAPIASGQRPQATGILMLDNCDPVYQGKAAYADNFSCIDAKGKVLFRVSGLNNCESIGSSHMIAVDAARKCVWVTENVSGRLVKYDMTGRELLVLNDVKANAVAVDPATGHVWVLTSAGTIYGDKTVVFDTKGGKQATHEVSGFDIAYDPKGKAFWIAGQNLAKVTAAGDIVVNKKITTWCASSLAVNPTTGDVWVGVREHPQVANSKDQLLGFDADGVLQTTVPLAGGTPFHVAVDPRDGAVWVTIMRESVQRYTAEGKLDGQHKLHALASEVEPRTGNVWFATENDVVRIDKKGKVLIRVKHKGKTTQAWMAGF